MMSFFEKELKVRITFTEPVLGSAPNTEEIYKEFIASKAPDAATTEDEVAALGAEAVEERGTTVFTRDEEGNPTIWDYQIRGFFKGTCGFLQRAKKRKKPFLSSSVKAYKKTIDGNVFVFPRQIKLNVPEGVDVRELDILQRPLRAQTAQGERIALASSEMLPAGTWFDISIGVLSSELEPVVLEWLDFGELNGLGQWRNGSNGRFTYELLEDE